MMRFGRTMHEIMTFSVHLHTHKNNNKAIPLADAKSTKLKLSLHKRSRYSLKHRFH